MADVTIQQLSRGTPTGNNILPYSTGSSTLGVPVSAIFQNTSEVRIDGKLGIGSSGPAVYKLELRAANPDRGMIGLVYNNDFTSAPKTGALLQFTQANVVDWAIGQPGPSGSFSFLTDRNYQNDGIERMAISTSGIVTKPFQPYLEAYVGTTVGTSNYNHDFSTSQVTPLVKYNSIIRQQGSNYNTDTGLFTAPAAGVYMVHAGVAIVVNSNLDAGYTGNICTELWGVINGGRNITLTDGPLQPYIAAIRHGCAPFYLNAGDTFGIKAFGVSSSGYSIQVNSAHSVLRIAFLG